MKIRDIRKMMGLSQREFAEKYAISLPTLQHWERDYTQPPKYFIMLLEKSIGIDKGDAVCFKGKHGETYIYHSSSNTISNIDGDTLHVTAAFDGVKQENAGLYLSELFDSVSQAKKLFLMDCEEDLRSDILWVEN